MQAEVSDLQNQVRSELKEVLRLQYLIQAELDDLNTLTKPDGCLAKAITEGKKSMELLAAASGNQLNEDFIKKFKDVRTNI